MVPVQILYVDDEPDIREVATLSLEMDPGIRVRTAVSGQAALKILDEEEWRPDAILLDVMMPEMDGPGVLALVRTRRGLSDTPVIFITARAQAHDRERLLALGAAGVVTKPFDPMSLAAEVRDILKVAR